MSNLEMSSAPSTSFGKWMYQKFNPSIVYFKIRSTNVIGTLEIEFAPNPFGILAEYTKIIEANHKECAKVSNLQFLTRQ